MGSTPLASKKSDKAISGFQQIQQLQAVVPGRTTFVVVVVVVVVVSLNFLHVKTS